MLNQNGEVAAALPAPRISLRRVELAFDSFEFLPMMLLHEVNYPAWMKTTALLIVVGGLCYTKPKRCKSTPRLLSCNRRRDLPDDNLWSAETRGERRIFAAHDGRADPCTEAARFGDGCTTVARAARAELAQRGVPVLRIERNRVDQRNRVR